MAITNRLQKLIKEVKNSEIITYGRLIELLGEQGIGIIIILFALPSALPISIIPGISFLFGLPIMFVAIQLILANKTLWLPQYLTKQTITTSKLITIITKTLPYLSWLERLTKPRWQSLFFFQRIHGLLLLVLSVFLSLPIPFSNFIFSGIIICFGISIAVKDGILMSITYLCTFIYLFILFSLTSHLIHYFNFS